MSTPKAIPKKPPRGHSQAPSPFFLKQQQANTHPSDTTSPNTYSPSQKQQQSPHTSFLSGSRITSPIHHPMTTNTTTSFDQHSFQEEQPSSFQEQQQPFNMSLFQQYSQQQEHYNDSNIFLNHEQHVIIPLSTCSFSTPLFSSIGESTPISPSRSRLSSKLGGELTVGEIEGEVIHISSPHDQLISYYCNRGGVIYPNIIIPHLLYGEESGYSTQQYEDSMMHDHGTNNNNNNNSSFLSHFIHTSIPLVSSHIYEYLQKLTRYIPYLQAMVSMKVPSYMLLLKRRNSLPPHSNNTSAMTGPTTTTTTATNNVTTNATTTTTTSGSTMNTTTTTPTPTPMNDDGVQCMDFHPFLMTMAILLHDDHIYFYNILNEEWSEQVLRHEFQFNVSMIKYKPTKQNESVLAVACEHGILIWDIHRRLPGMSHSTIMSAASSSTTTMNSERMKDVSRNGVCVFLPSSTRVNGISWGVHSQQQYLLASSSLLDHRVFIWSCHESTNQDWKLLKTLTKFNGGVRHVEFSPDSKYLFVSHITNVFRVYETRNFDFCEKWSCFDQPVKSMAWHGSEYLFIVTEDSDCIHVLRDETSYLMNRTESTMWSTSSGGGGNGHHHTMGGTSSGGGGSGHTMGGTSSSNGSSHPINDEFHFEYQCKIPLALYSPFKTHSSLSHMKCCGKIRQIQVHGERLIVSFEQTPLLAVIQIDCSSTRHFICRPMGYIRGPTPKLLRDVKKKSTTRLTLRTPDESTQPIMHEDDENSNTSSSDIFSQVIEESNSNGYHLQFWNNFEKGSLLSVCWKGMDKDKISLYPFYYHVVKPQWNTLYDENNQFYRSRLNKNIERQQLDHDDEEDDTDEPVVGISHTPFKLFDD